MLSKEFRLKNSFEIGEVFKKGNSTSDKFLFLKYRKNQEENSRVAFSVGLKFSKNAAKRNRAKRLLREAMRLLIEKINSNVDMVVCFKNMKISENDLTIESLNKSLKNALHRAHLI